MSKAGGVVNDNGSSTSSESDVSLSFSDDSDDEILQPINLDVLLKSLQGENLVLEYRVKLYSLVKKTWMDRGLGNIRIYRSIEDDMAIRVVFWDDITFKLGCNFRLFPKFTVEYFNNDPKLLLWLCEDYTGGFPVVETFAVKFQTTDKSQHFKETLEGLTQFLGGNQSAGGGD